MSKVMVSEERKKYIRKKRNKKYLVIATQILILICSIVLWEYLADKEVIDSFITSKPSRILETFMNLSSNNLPKHIGVTAYETIVGFLLGTFLGIIVAIILWWSDFLARVSEPYLVILNSLPKVALRTNNNNLGRSWYICNYNNGNFNIIDSDNSRKSKWIFKDR